jgi:hypothetical protein
LGVAVPNNEGSSRSFLLTAHQNRETSISVRGFNALHLDAAGIDRYIVLERWLIEIPMDRTEKGEVGTT